MRHLINKIKLPVLGCVYGAMISFPAAADDIEIYTNTSNIDPDIQANVLFLLDTSLSMGATVVTLEPYDPSIDYKTLTPNQGYPCFDKSLIYRIGGNVSNKAKAFCDGNNSGDIFPATNGNKKQVAGTAKIKNFYCENASMIVGGAESPTSTGFYLGSVAKYRGGTKRWRTINRNDPNAVVECEADQGVHGKTSGGPEFATAKTNQANPWTSVAADAFDWSGFATHTIYTGNYLNYLQTAPGTSTYRIELIRDVMRDFIKSTTGINLGFMPYSQKKLASPSGALGGMVEVAIDDIETTRADIDARLVFYGTQHDPSDTSLKSGHNNLVLGTPLSQQYFEAMRYFQGKAAYYGLDSLPKPSVSDSLVSGSTANPLPVGTLYKSPISKECQKNYIVVLTDGAPYRDPLTASQLDEMGADNSCALECTTGGCGDKNCLDHLAYAAGSIDQDPSLIGDQVISTFTIAFGANIGILNKTTAASRATTGEGASFVANDAAELSTHLKTVVAAVLDAENTFSSPAVSVNAFNRAVHLDDLYFTLFKPDEGPHWDGNFKKYKLKSKKDTLDFDNDGDTEELIPFIEDARPDEAINAATGFFDNNSLSYWTDPADPDGSDVTQGGMVGELTTSRKVYTYSGSYTFADGIYTPDDKNIIKAENKVESANKDDVTASLLDISATDTIVDGLGNTVLLHDALLDWAKGVDVLDEYPKPISDGKIDDVRAVMGDPLHSQPAIVQYGGTAAAPDLTAFVATNDGYLHAVDTDTGEELWSFIPQELLPNLQVLMENKSGVDKSYALDGNVVPWIDDQNGDGIISGSDTVRLYIGMRRGGDKIFALDVTDRSAPKLLWVIDGGIAGTAYEELGDTWSTINVANIKDGASSRKVLIFGGGYDDGQDNSSGSAIERHTDGVGRTVFIADAITGKRLWSAGKGGEATANMEYSIPARVKPLDLSGDGNIDRLYAVDMGGQIFRFDIDETAASFNNAAIDGGRLADLAKDGSAADARRFYYPPDVAIVAAKGKAAYLGLAISSGYRAHPTETRVEDRIYLLKDYNIYDSPDYTKLVALTEDDLYDATLNFASEGNGNATQTASASTDLESKDGWYIKLDDEQTPPSFVGEKGLAEPLIVENTVIVTTFVPETGANINSCTPKEGSGKVFFLDIFDATAAYPSNVDVRSDRSIPLASAGIPPSPNVIITEDAVPTTCIGTECRSLGDSIGLRKTFWYEVEK